jgi:hypothetical protein
VKDKTTIRYIGFRSAVEGGRIFDFAISATDRDNFSISVEIPSELFAGPTRIHLQEGVGISYAKLKTFFDVSVSGEMAPPTKLPALLCLTASDLALYREQIPESKRRHGFPPPRTDWNEMGNRKTP